MSGAGPSGREVISLQKADSLLVLVNIHGELKSFCFRAGPEESGRITFKIETQ
jgi:hypothetical protein